MVAARFSHDTGSRGCFSTPVRVNEVGLRRGGFSEETITRLKKAFRLLVLRRGGTLDEACAEVESAGIRCPEVDELIEFLRRKSSNRFGRVLDTRGRVPKSS